MTKSQPFSKTNNGLRERHVIVLGLALRWTSLYCGVLLPRVLALIANTHGFKGKLTLVLLYSEDLDVEYPRTSRI